jgi:cytoskeletal protein CcmA (bactofilin family)
MFWSKKAPAPAVVTKAPAPAPSLKRLAKGSAPSIISSDLVVNGTLTSTGEMQIDGRVEGDVRSAGLVIGEAAVIHGDIVGEDVTVRGRVQGNIRAHKVHLASSCHVEGNIHRRAMAVESGAFFEGSSRHSDDPLSDGNGSKNAAADSRSLASVVKLPH